MSAAVTIFGWICLISVCITAAGIAVAVAATQVSCALERFEFAIAEKTRAAIGRSLLVSSHWFSESPDAQIAIATLAARLRDQYGVDANQWREEWRRLRIQNGGSHGTE